MDWHLTQWLMPLGNANGWGDASHSDSSEAHSIRTGIVWDWHHQTAGLWCPCFFFFYIYPKRGGPRCCLGSALSLGREKTLGSDRGHCPLQDGIGIYFQIRNANLQLLQGSHQQALEVDIQRLLGKLGRLIIILGKQVWWAGEVVQLVKCLSRSVRNPVQNSNTHDRRVALCSSNPWAGMVDTGRSPKLSD